MLNKYMELALNEAKKVKKDIPVGCIIVKDDEVIAIASNRREIDNKTTAHAEILAIEEANKKLNSWRLDDCDMYVTLEPCPMCAWAIINARIKNLYFALSDTKYGAFGGAINLAKLANSKINVYQGILEDEARGIIDNYFKNMRN